MPFVFLHVSVERRNAEAQEAAIVDGQDAVRDGAVHGRRAIAAVRGFDRGDRLAARHGVRLRGEHGLDDRPHRVAVEQGVQAAVVERRAGFAPKGQRLVERTRRLQRTAAGIVGRAGAAQIAVDVLRETLRLVGQQPGLCTGDLSAQGAHAKRDGVHRLFAA